MISVHIYVILVTRRVKTPAPHHTNTCIKLTIVTHLLFFSERLAIANLCVIVWCGLPLLSHTSCAKHISNRNHVPQLDIWSIAGVITNSAVGISQGAAEQIKTSANY